ncbi:DUF4306 domain-containing protein [Ureibacillus manganicus]|uniref:DUF4306 domain-containing protein n=1 Tax=Ureibacillus manganicus TaxID=1266064 RepID=UPI00055AF69B|nr:DUF4306 domain-containing protein [Ureibacillus manganicus]
MFKYILQFLIGGVVLLFSTLAAWYEGSAIIEKSLEWNYSTPFTHFLGIEITTGKEIVVIDYFVYALKFQPFFPMLMLLSLFYIIGITLVLVGKKNIHFGMKLAFLCGIVFLCTSTLFYKSTTDGGRIFFYLLLTSSILTTLISGFLYTQQRYKEQIVE